MEMSAPPRKPEEPEDAQLAKLYRESAAPGPSPDMDQAILAAARREVHARPRRAGPWLRQWRVPVSIAATLVVSASLVMVMVEEGGNRMAGSPPMAPAPARQEAPAPGPPATDDLAARGPSAAAPEGSAERRGDAPSPIAAERAERDAAAARRSPKSSPGREPASEARPLAASPRAQPAPPPAALARPFPAAPPASEVAPRAEVEDRAAPRPEPAAPRAAEMPPRDALGGTTAGSLQARRERTEDAGTAAPGSSRPSLGIRGFTDTPQPVTPSQDAVGRAAPPDPPKAVGPDAHAQERRDPAAAATVSPPAAKRMPSTQAAPKPRPESRGAVLARGLVDQPPEKWLERVEQLRREDRHSDADELLGEFRRRFPAHPAAQRAPGTE